MAPAVALRADVIREVVTAALTAAVFTLAVDHLRLGHEVLAADGDMLSTPISPDGDGRAAFFGAAGEVQKSSVHELHFSDSAKHSQELFSRIR